MAINASSISCKYPDAPFKQEYIVPQIIYQLCSEKKKFTGVKYYSTKWANCDRDKLKNAMINYALPAQDIKRSGYCPELANHLALTEPITINECEDMQIESKCGYTANGFPIISNMCNSMKENETVLALDRMTMHYDSLVTSFLKDRNLNVLKPLNGWKDET